MSAESQLRQQFPQTGVGDESVNNGKQILDYASLVSSEWRRSVGLIFFSTNASSDS
jgi:hypothetical protein